MTRGINLGDLVSHLPRRETLLTHINRVVHYMAQGAKSYRLSDRQEERALAATDRVPLPLQHCSFKKIRLLGYVCMPTGGVEVPFPNEF